MNIKQKAEAYDEAINKITDAVETGTIEQGLAEWLFPELKENNDEKLKEQVVYAINQLHVCECTKNKLLDWVEKQSKKSIIVPKFREGDKIHRKTPSSFDKDMEIARIDKDYYVCNHIGKFSSEVVKFSEEDSYELVEEKPINWTYKDEEMKNLTIAFLDEFKQKGYENAVMCIDWINTLINKINIKYEL